ncbi:glutamate mutase L [uncultured Megasphaera sp.]|uniref:glutamate mutase L n=1 Tax=uncultured Megasphaera sp. TaxID=165188 RepID=UPI00265852E2|nr:glutamate mutase L [uncultured Megasphaera sp.]
MELATLIDFGSTFTKATVLSLTEREIVYTFRTPSTVQNDASIGLRICLDAIEQHIGRKALASSQKLASSSAAGGLRMVVIGLTDSLSLTAGKNAAYGAGAKVIRTFSHRLTTSDIDEIYTLQPEIILLCGGYEGGNSSWVLENVRKLAQCAGLTCPIVYAGNSAVQKEVRFLFAQHQKACVIADNIIPSIGQLNISSSVQAVRDIFMNRITHMKGFDTVKTYVGPIVMPTPAAVLEGVKLLAQGTDKQPGWEQVLLVDMGGATTDIHSWAPVELLDGVHFIGSPEPQAKRTVEGDIGMRESIASLVEVADTDRLLQLTGQDDAAIKTYVKERLENHAFLANTRKEQQFEQAAAMEGVRVAARRHAGRIYDGYFGNKQKVQTGKNLCRIKAIVGTGGPIIGALSPAAVLYEACRHREETHILLPMEAAYYLDTSYICYAAGLLAQMDREAAFAILSQSLQKLDVTRGE